MAGRLASGWELGWGPSLMCWNTRPTRVLPHDRSFGTARGSRNPPQARRTRVVLRGVLHTSTPPQLLAHGALCVVLSAGRLSSRLRVGARSCKLPSAPPPQCAPARPPVASSPCPLPLPPACRSVLGVLRVFPELLPDTRAMTGQQDGDGSSSSSTGGDGAVPRRLAAAASVRGSGAKSISMSMSMRVGGSGGVGRGDDGRCDPAAALELLGQAFKALGKVNDAVRGRAGAGGVRHGAAAGRCVGRGLEGQLNGCGGKC